VPSATVRRRIRSSIVMFRRPRIVLTILSAYSMSPILEYLNKSLPLVWRVRLKWPRLAILGIVCIICLIARLATTPTIPSTKAYKRPVDRNDYSDRSIFYQLPGINRGIWRDGSTSASFNRGNDDTQPHEARCITRQPNGTS